MKRAGKFSHGKRRGFALIIAMIFVLVFSALAVSMATMSGMNVQLASNQHKLNGALASAASGVEIIRFWLSHVSISGTTAPSERFNQIANSLQGELAANSITNVTTSYSGSAISIPSVTLDSAIASSFFAAINAPRYRDTPDRRHRRLWHGDKDHQGKLQARRKSKQCL